MIKKIFYITILAFFLQTSPIIAGSTGSENLKGSKRTSGAAGECFEGTSRAVFNFNLALDKAIFKPVAKGYRAIPLPIRKSTGNFVGNLRSLLTLSNNVLQGDFSGAGNTLGRFAINSTAGILGVFDPATRLGLAKRGKEDFGQTLGVWGTETGCYFVLPVLGPTTVRDAFGKVGNVFLDPVYQVTHNTEVDGGIGNESYSEHNYFIYRGAGSVDFRANNIESIDSLEKNSIDFYASVKSLYLQDRIKKISNSNSPIETKSDNDWEEIED